MNVISSSLKFECFAICDAWASRRIGEPANQIRSNFSKDRDRILYSKGFRRLSGKTQVFVVGFDDHCRTRLTHTLEVSQIATTISKMLGLNVELTEAIALGHDVGHTPFGHVGERFLNLLMNGCYNARDFNQNLPDSEKGFKHNLQSLRVVSSLEKHNSKFPNDGLNLTNFTKWGIVNHTGYGDNKCQYSTKNATENNDQKLCGYMKNAEECPLNGKYSTAFYDIYINQFSDSDDWSYEAFVVAIADEIAQRHHDIEDGIEAKILKKDIIIDKIEELFSTFFDDDDKEGLKTIRGENDSNYCTPLISHLIVNLLVKQVVENSKRSLQQLKIEYKIDKDNFFAIRQSLIRDDEKKRISYSNEFELCEQQLSKYLFGMIINSYLAQKMDGKSDYLLRQITKAYITNPQQLPDGTIITLFYNLRKGMGTINAKPVTIEKIFLEQKCDPDKLKDIETGILRIILNKLHKSKEPLYEQALLRTICDYIAGMTDQYAIDQYNELYGIGSKK